MSFPRTRTLSVCLCFAFGSFLLAGCGGSSDAPEMGYVTGTVKMDGKPLKNALVTFRPQDHETARQSVGTTDDNGEYELKYSLRETGVMLGNHQVTISTAGMGGGEYGENGGQQGTGEKVPAQYNVKTELTAVVEPGSQTIDFVDLKSEGEIIEQNDGEGY